MRTPPPELTENLLAIGEQVLSEPDIRLEDVARTVGTSRARMYYYFAGAPDLRSFLVREHAREGGAAVAEAAAGPGSAADRMRGVVLALIDLLSRRPGLCAGLLGEVGSAESLATHDAAVARPLRELIAEGVLDDTLVAANPAMAADALAGAILLGVLGHVRRHGDPLDEVAARALADQVLDGLARPAGLGRGVEHKRQSGA